jgi:hypothetical protein
MPDEDLLKDSWVDVGTVEQISPDVALFEKSRDV